MDSSTRKYLPIILTLIGLTITILNYFKSKELSSRSEIQCFDELYDIEPFEAKLKLTYADSACSSLCRTDITFINSGNFPILFEDFIRPISLYPTDSLSIIDIKITSPEKSELSPQVRIENDTVEISPLLLNEDDQFILTLFTTGGIPEFDISTRIVGISEIQSVKKLRKSIHLEVVKYGLSILLFFLTLFGFLLTSTGSTLGMFNEKKYEVKPRKWIHDFIGYFILIASMVIFVGAIPYYREWNQFLMWSVSFGMLLGVLAMFEKRFVGIYKKIPFRQAFDEHLGEKTSNANAEDSKSD